MKKDKTPSFITLGLPITLRDKTHHPKQVYDSLDHHFD